MHDRISITQLLIAITALFSAWTNGKSFASAARLCWLQDREHVAQDAEPTAESMNPIGKPVPLNQLAGWRQATYEEFLAESTWPSAHPMLLNAITKIRYVPWRNLQAYATTTTQSKQHSHGLFPWDEWRGHVFELSGIVHRVVTIKLPEQVRLQFGIEQFYLASVHTEGQDYQIACRQVPTVWAKGKAPLSEPFSCFGFLLKTLNGGEPVFAADSLSWLPDQTNSTLDVNASHVWLARQGIDIGLRERINHRSTTAIDDGEVELLLELLRLTSGRRDMIQLEPQPTDLISWLRQPEESFGSFYRVEGRLKKISVIEVEAPHLKEKFNLQRYYQLDVFIPAPDIRILDQAGKQLLDDKGKPFVYSNSYAIAVLCPELPVGISMEGKRSLATDEEIVIDSFFFKKWEQRNFRTRNVSPDLVKSTPLLIGYTPTLQGVQPTFNWSYSVAIGLLGLFLGAFAITVIWLGRKERDARRSQQSQRSPDKIDCDF